MSVRILDRSNNSSRIFFLRRIAEKERLKHLMFRLFKLILQSDSKHSFGERASDKIAFEVIQSYRCTKPPFLFFSRHRKKICTLEFELLSPKLIDDRDLALNQLR